MANIDHVEKDVRAIKKANEERLTKFPGVTGIYTGRKTVNGQKTETLAIVVVVQEKKSLSQLSADEVIPAEIDGVPTDVKQGNVPTEYAQQLSDAEVKLQSTGGPGNAFRRPLVGGIQVSVTINTSTLSSGTLGCFVQDTQGNLYGLTCAHVVKTANAPVFQPDPSFLPIGTSLNLIQNLSIDAALIQIPSGIGIQNYVLRTGSVQGSYVIKASEAVDYAVQKQGITTGLTFGTVESIDYTVVFQGQTLKTNQILIQGSARQPLFSHQGDSGSVIMNDQYQVLGVLWGGDDVLDQTWACHIDDVCSSLNVSVVTNQCPPLYVVHNGYGPSGNCNQASYLTQWSPDAQITPAIGVEYSPSIAMFDDHLYNIRNGRGSYDVWCSKFDGNLWSVDTQLAPSEDAANFYGTTGAPGLATYCGELNCVHDGKSANGQVWWFKHTKGFWSADTQLPFNAISPSLVVYKGLLYCFTSTRLAMQYCTYQWNAGGGLWGSNNPVGTGYETRVAPCVVTYNGLLYCFHLSGYTTDTNIYYCTFDGTKWSADLPVLPPGYLASSTRQTAVVWNGVLYLFYVDANGSDVYYLTLQNGVWSPRTAAGFASSDGVALGSIPTYKHTYFEMAPNSRYLYATVEGNIYGLMLGTSQPSWALNNPAAPPNNKLLQNPFNILGPPGPILFAFSQYGELMANDIYHQSTSWVANFPSTQPEIAFAFGCGVNGYFNIPAWIFALDALGILYSAQIPSGAWSVVPDPPEKFYRLCALDQAPGADGTLFALGASGVIWTIGVPTAQGKWSNSMVPAPPPNVTSIAVTSWIINYGPNTSQTNLYAVDQSGAFWGCQLGSGGWTKNWPVAAPAELSKLFNVAGAGLTYAADRDGNFYSLNSQTNVWQTNYPVPLPPPEL
ncbi:MAG: hypothetical protein C0469_08005 [Cyanobacteria bacterium DS2.3.42]|nr:hypothetical protein [Cyanobacteria bacterium DS2.3.42]